MAFIEWDFIIMEVGNILLLIQEFLEDNQINNQFFQNEPTLKNFGLD
jgi:hypothetical protein